MKIICCYKICAVVKYVKQNRLPAAISYNYSNIGDGFLVFLSHYYIIFLKNPLHLCKYLFFAIIVYFIEIIEKKTKFPD